MEIQQINIDTDEMLVKKVLAHDHKAFDIIISNSERLVCQIVFKMVNDGGNRKDLVQDIYLKVYHKLSKFRFESKLSTWIAQIAYHTCLHYLEKRKLILVSALSKDDDSEINLLEKLMGKTKNSALNDIEQNIFNQERSHLIQEAIDMLPPLYKTLIVLFHQEELSYAEIAEITHLPDGTIKNYIFRARKTMKDYLLIHHQNNEI